MTKDLRNEIERFITRRADEPSIAYMIREGVNADRILEMVGTGDKLSAINDERAALIEKEIDSQQGGPPISADDANRLLLLQGVTLAYVSSKHPRTLLPTDTPKDRGRG